MCPWHKLDTLFLPFLVVTVLFRCPSCSPVHSVPWQQYNLFQLVGNTHGIVYNVSGAVWGHVWMLWGTVQSIFWDDESTWVGRALSEWQAISCQAHCKLKSPLLWKLDIILKLYRYCPWAHFYLVISETIK